VLCPPHPIPPTFILNRKLVFCFLIKIQKRLDTILRWVQYYVAQTPLSGGLCSQSLKFCRGVTYFPVTSQIWLPMAWEAT
jgi:hypothetical protein